MLIENQQHNKKISSVVIINDVNFTQRFEEYIFEI